MKTQKLREITLNRLEQFKGDNHIKGHLYGEQVPVRLEHWAAPDRVTFRNAAVDHAGDFSPVDIGCKSQALVIQLSTLLSNLHCKFLT